MISYGEFLWGNLMGMSYGAFLSGFLMSSAGLGRLGWAGPDHAGPARAGLGWHGLAWDVMGLQSTVENPHKISP